MVRDPVISDKMQSDTSGRCWRQSESESNELQLQMSPS